MFPEYINQLFYLVGEAVVLLVVLILILSIIVSMLVLYSFKTGNFFAARYMLLGIVLLENVIKTLFWISRADDSIVDDVGVRLRNYINNKEFLKTPCADAIHLHAPMRSQHRVSGQAHAGGHKVRELRALQRR